MATLTITTTAAQDARLVKAFGTELGLPGNASAAQIRGAVIVYLIEVVKRQEQREAKRLAKIAADTVAPIDLT